jgi:hypothetical protein
MHTVSKLRKRRAAVSESIAHEKIIPSQAEAIPNLTVYPHGDQYFHMRTMVLAASLPEEPKISAYSQYEDNPCSVGYTKEEQQMLDRAAALCGHPGKRKSSSTSVESPEIYKMSPCNHNSGKHPQ